MEVDNEPHDGDGEQIPVLQRVRVINAHLSTRVPRGAGGAPGAEEVARQRYELEQDKLQLQKDTNAAKLELDNRVHEFRVFQRAEQDTMANREQERKEMEASWKIAKMAREEFSANLTTIAETMSVCMQTSVPWVEFANTFAGAMGCNIRAVLTDAAILAFNPDIVWLMLPPNRRRDAIATVDIATAGASLGASLGGPRRPPSIFETREEELREIETAVRDGPVQDALLRALVKRIRDVKAAFVDAHAGLADDHKYAMIFTPLGFGAMEKIATYMRSIPAFSTTATVRASMTDFICSPSLRTIYAHACANEAVKACAIAGGQSEVNARFRTQVTVATLGTANAAIQQIFDTLRKRFRRAGDLASFQTELGRTRWEDCYLALRELQDPWALY